MDCQTFEHDESPQKEIVRVQFNLSDYGYESNQIGLAAVTPSMAFCSSNGVLLTNSRICYATRVNGCHPYGLVI